MMRRLFSLPILCAGLLAASFAVTSAMPTQAATVGIIAGELREGQNVARDIRVVRLNGLRLTSVSAPVLTSGGSPGVDIDFNQLRNFVIAEYRIDTGDVAPDESAFGWIDFSGVLTVTNTFSSARTVTLLTDMLAQGILENPDPTKRNLLEAIVTLKQDGETRLSATMGGPGVTRLNQRVGAGSPLGGITTLTVAPGATSVLEYSFFAQTIVNAPLPSPVPLPASGAFLLLGLGLLASRRIFR